ncbi:MAG: PucR family transcriptional regulator [Ktedonobacteraceae bacterium]
MSSSPPISSASVRSILTLLASRDASLVAGAEGLERRITWACSMRARLPAFDSIQGGELALLTLAKLRRLNETLPHLLTSLHKEGVAAVAVAAQSLETLGTEVVTLANQLHLPLILLPPLAPIEEIEREVIAFVVSFRDEIERKATGVSQQLMQLSIQGVGIAGVCESLAISRGKWVVMQDAEQHIRFQAAPSATKSLLLSDSLTDEFLRSHGLARVVEPILIRHEIVGYLSLIGDESSFDYSERLVLNHVTPIFAIEFARERERSEVEGRYHVEAFMNVLQGQYQQPEEILARVRHLGYDLTGPQIVVLFEAASNEEDATLLQWTRRIREEMVRAWPTCWLMSDAQRITVLVPVVALADEEQQGETEEEQTLVARIERFTSRLQQNRGNVSLPLFSCGIGRMAMHVQGIPQSFREAQRAVEIGRRLFGEGKIHSFARLGIYRLLFYLDGQSELTTFYQEMLGPLLDYDARHDGTYIKTLECYFQYNGNLSQTARTMHFHRNSLIYRLERIEEILGRSLEDAELRLSLQIALKIHHLHHED